MKKSILALCIILILINSQVATAQSYEISEPDSLANLFSPFFADAIQNDGSMARDLFGADSIRTGVSNGLGLVTLMKLYDLYNKSSFLNYAKEISSFMSTALIDLRYPLIATYYDNANEITSNYRAVEDNFLTAWGLAELSERIDVNDELEVKIQEDRAEFVAADLDMFVADLGFNPQIRVDTPISTTTFKVFPNLFAAYIISESQSPLLEDFSTKPEEILEYVAANATTSDGGVNTLVFNGISDNLVTLKNTALYANLAMNLYLSTEDNTFLDIANSTMQYIQDAFYDIGVTGGYIESLIDNTPIQQSKSLFSHALILQLLLKLANLGDNQARLNLLAIWRTINEYFRVDNYFYSTLDRGGDPGSDVIDTVDNLMMMYSMSSLPLFTKLNYTRSLDYNDQIRLMIELNIPANINSELVLFDDDGEEVETRELSGDSQPQNFIISFDPSRPSDEEEIFDYRMELRSEGVVTDTVDFQIRVSLSPGIDLSVGAITVFSIFAVVIFALFVKRSNEETSG